MDKVTDKLTEQRWNLTGTSKPLALMLYLRHGLAFTKLSGEAILITENVRKPLLGSLQWSHMSATCKETHSLFLRTIPMLLAFEVWPFWLGTGSI